MDVLIRIIVSLAIIALLALEGSYLYFWLARKGRHTSFHSESSSTKKCPLCGSVVEDENIISNTSGQKVLNQQPMH